MTAAAGRGPPFFNVYPQDARGIFCSISPYNESLYFSLLCVYPPLTLLLFSFSSYVVPFGLFYNLSQNSLSLQLQSRTSFSFFFLFEEGGPTVGPGASGPYTDQWAHISNPHYLDRQIIPLHQRLSFSALPYTLCNVNIYSNRTWIYLIIKAD